jgi:hypothetical protein
LDEMQDYLAADGMWTPVLSPWPDATVGGMVASNFNAPCGCVTVASATWCWRRRQCCRMGAFSAPGGP